MFSVLWQLPQKKDKWRRLLLLLNTIAIYAKLANKSKIYEEKRCRMKKKRVLE